MNTSFSGLGISGGELFIIAMAVMIMGAGAIAVVVVVAFAVRKPKTAAGPIPPRIADVQKHSCPHCGGKLD